MEACSISGATDKEGGSCDGKEKKFSEVLGERTKRRGVWLVTFLNVEEMELLVGKTPGGVYFAPDACSTPREEVYT